MAPSGGRGRMMKKSAMKRPRRTWASVTDVTILVRVLVDFGQMIALIIMIGIAKIK